MLRDLGVSTLRLTKIMTQFSSLFGASNQPCCLLQCSGQLAYSAEFLQWADSDSLGHIDAAGGGAFFSLTIVEATELIKKMVSNQGWSDDRL
jgi:hypothetical protein